MGKYPWPRWWDDHPHPDVPFPHINIVRDYPDGPPSPQEVIELALAEAGRNKRA